MKTREFNGLRVMMAVMNNWDLKDVNNAVFRDKKAGQDILLVSDVGATFGTNGLSWTVARSKGNIGTFKESKFITHETDTEVNFATPKPPTARLIETGGIPETRDYASRVGFDWIGDNVPRADARWMGAQLGQLSHQQRFAPGIFRRTRSMRTSASSRAVSTNCRVSKGGCVVSI